MFRTPARGLAILLTLALGAGPPGATHWPAGPSSRFGSMLRLSTGPLPVPAIAFVSRAPVPGEPRIVPGLGPVGRTVATGGRLLVREANGRIRELLQDGALFDVADPAISFDARRVAFAGIARP